MGATPRQRAFAAIANLNTLGVSKAPPQQEIALRDLGCLPDYRDVDTFIDTLVDPLNVSALPPLDGTDSPSDYQKVRTSFTVNPASATAYSRGGQIFIPPGCDYRTTMAIYDAADPISNTVSVASRATLEEVVFAGGVDSGANVTTFPEGGNAASSCAARLLSQTVRFEYIGAPSTCQGALEVYIPDRRTQTAVSAGLSYNGFQNSGATVTPGRSVTSGGTDMDVTHIPLSELLQRGSVDFHWLPQEKNDWKFLNNMHTTPMICLDTDVDTNPEVRAKFNMVLNGASPLTDWDCGRVQIGTETGLLVGNSSQLLTLAEKLKYNAPWLCWFVTSCTDVANAKLRVTVFSTVESRFVYTTANQFTNAAQNYRRRCPIPGGVDFVKAASNMIRGSHHLHSRGSAREGQDALRSKLGALAAAHM